MFTVQYVKNLQWGNAEHTYFSCVVKLKSINPLPRYPYVVLPVNSPHTAKYLLLLKVKYLIFLTRPLSPA